MKQLRYVDFDCPSCGAPCTRFVRFDTDSGAPCDEDEVQRCLEPLAGPLPRECGALLAPREMCGIGYVKPIAKGNSDFNERERERLQKRADDHWKRQGRDEAIDRERAYLKKHGAVGGVR